MTRWTYIRAYVALSLCGALSSMAHGQGFGCSGPRVTIATDQITFQVDSVPDLSVECHAERGDELLVTWHTTYAYEFIEGNWSWMWYASVLPPALADSTADARIDAAIASRGHLAAQIAVTSLGRIRTKDGSVAIVREYRNAGRETQSTYGPTNTPYTYEIVAYIATGRAVTLLGVRSTGTPPAIGGARRFLDLVRSFSVVPGTLAAAGLRTRPETRVSAGDGAAIGTGIFSGAVVRDTLSHAISGAAVLIPSLGESVVTDGKGEFKFSDLPAGRYGILIRRLGFQQMYDTIDVTPKAPVDREYVMDPQAVRLDSVVTRSDRATPRLSPHVALFEEHRKAGTGGYFLTDSVLRKNENRSFTDVMTSLLPAVHLYYPVPVQRPTLEYLSSGRGTGRGLTNCPVALWLDGARQFPLTQDGTPGQDDYPDMSGFQVSGFAAVEYYVAGASLPLQFTGGAVTCGTLVLWTREKQ